MAKKKRVFERLNRSLKEKKPLELLVKTNFSSKERVIRALSKHSIKTHDFRFIPWFYIKLPGKKAIEFVTAVLKSEEHNSEFYDEIKEVLSLIKEIDIPGKVRKLDYNIGYEIPSSSLTKELVRDKLTRKIQTEYWNLKAIHSIEANKISVGSGIKVGVIDTGIDYEHEELKERFSEEKGYDFIKEDNDPYDLNGHGTHVAGIITGKSVGVAKEVQLYALRVLDEEGAGSEVDVMRAVEWSLEEKLDIINLSLGSPESTEAFEDLCYYAFNNGLLIIAAAGNEGFGIEYPAGYDGVIAVTAVTEGLRHAYFSNIAETNDIAAPGVNVLSSFPNNTYEVLSGTSMATPHVTGAMAVLKSLLESRGESARPSELEEIMKGTTQALKNTTEYPYEYVFGSGLLRVDKMVLSGARQ